MTVAGSIRARHRPLAAAVADCANRGRFDREIVQAGSFVVAQLSQRIMSAAFSAIITTGDAVLPETIVGMIEASTTRSPSSP